jgi:hypothetical protein
MDQINGRGVPDDCTPAIQPLSGSFSVENNATCIAPSTGNVSCRFVGSASGGQPPYTFDWRFTNPANQQVRLANGQQVSPALGCDYSAGTVTFTVQIALTIGQQSGSSVTVTGSRLITRADGACGT